MSCLSATQIPGESVAQIHIVIYDFVYTLFFFIFFFVFLSLLISCIGSKEYFLISCLSLASYYIVIYLCIALSTHWLSKSNQDWLWPFSWIVKDIFFLLVSHQEMIKRIVDLATKWLNLFYVTTLYQQPHNSLTNG